MWRVVMVLVASCGRIGFDARGSTIASDGGSGDGGAVGDATLGPCNGFVRERPNVELADSPALALRGDGVLAASRTPQLEVERLASDGSPSPPSVVDVRTVERSVAIATDTGYLVAWIAGGNLYSREVQSDGTPVAAEMPHGAAATTDIGMVRRGNELGVMWVQSTGLRFQRWDLSGAPLAGAITINVSGVGTIDELVATDVGYAFVGDNGTNMIVVRLSSTGAVMNMANLGSSANMFFVRLAGAGTEQYASWTTLSSGMFVARVAATVSTPVQVSPISDVAAVAWTGERVGVVAATRDMNAQLLRLDVHWYDPALAPLGSASIAAHPWPNTSIGALGVPSAVDAPGRIVATIVYEVAASVPMQQTTTVQCY